MLQDLIWTCFWKNAIASFSFSSFICPGVYKNIWTSYKCEVIIVSVWKELFQMYQMSTLIKNVYLNLWKQLVGWLCWGLTSQSTIFQSCRDGAIASWVINQYFRGVKCLAQGHNTAAVGLEPRTSRSGVGYSTTEPPRSPCENSLSENLILYFLHILFWVNPTIK